MAPLPAMAMASRAAGSSGGLASRAAASFVPGRPRACKRASHLPHPAAAKNDASVESSSGPGGSGSPAVLTELPEALETMTVMPQVAPQVSVPVEKAASAKSQPAPATSANGSPAKVKVTGTALSVGANGNDKAQNSSGTIEILPATGPSAPAEQEISVPTEQDISVKPEVGDKPLENVASAAEVTAVTPATEEAESAPVAEVSELAPAAEVAEADLVAEASNDATVAEVVEVAATPAEVADVAAVAEPAEPDTVVVVDEPLAWEFVSEQELEGGRLQFIRLHGERLLRVWLPPGYDKHVVPESGHPVLLLNDGQNLFDDSLSFSGCSWRAAKAAAEAINSGDLPPFVILGVDHSGPTRSYDYCPCKPGPGDKNMREDARNWPGGGVDAYLDLLLDEVLPWATAEFNLAEDPSLRAFGGSSFGGICTLCMGMRFPGAFGSLLVESPSLWIDQGKFLSDTVAKYDGEWPSKVFMAMGGKEYSGIRKPHKDEEEFDKYLVKRTEELAAVLQQQGLDESRLQWRVDPEATHTEAAWMGRLPDALRFLAPHWWKPMADMHSEADFFCLPLWPTAGKPVTMFFNQSRTAELNHSGVKLHVGFNRWSLGNVTHGMTPADALSAHSESTWRKGQVSVPLDAWDMQFVFSNGSETIWKNADGSNFWKRVEVLGEASSDVQVMAHKNAQNLMFTVPAQPKSGEPITVYFNRQQSGALCNREPIKMRWGTDDWQNVETAQLHGTKLWRNGEQDWWCVKVDLPAGASEFNFVFTDGGDCWENNSGSNFTVPTKTSVHREVENEEINDHAAGKMHVLTLAKPKGLSPKAARAARWTTEKTVRVWTPPGFSTENPPAGGWPVIIFNDGQNKFEDWLAHQGVSWRLGYTASDLITSGRLPPFVVVAIDNSGPMRSLNYLPYPPGTGMGGFRGDAERWPGGGVEPYMQRVVYDILPVLQGRFALARHPSRVAFGGGSFGGICALYAAMKYPHVFGAVLAESPSLWIAEGRFLHDLFTHQGPLPERLFVGCGTKEYSATRDHDRQDVDDLLFHYYCETERCFREKGMGHDRFMFQVEQGAGHHELAWAWRLTGAMHHVLSHWWGRY